MPSHHPTIIELAARLATSESIAALLRERLNDAEQREQALLLEIQRLKGSASRAQSAQNGSRDE